MKQKDIEALATAYKNYRGVNVRIARILIHMGQGCVKMTVSYTNFYKSTFK